MHSKSHLRAVGVAIAVLVVVVTHVAVLGAALTSPYAITLAAALLVALVLKSLWMRRSR